MVQSATPRGSRRAERVRRRRLRRFAAIPRALVILGLATVTIVAPLTGFVQAQKPGLMTAHVLSVGGGSKSWAESPNKLASGDLETGLIPDPAANTRARILSADPQCQFSNVGSGNKGSELMANEGAILFPLERGTFQQTSPFGERIHPISGIRKLHTGTDFAAPAGTTIHAMTDGEVVFVGPLGGGGNAVRVKHLINGKIVYSQYKHMLNGSFRVAVGQKVKAGDPLGSVGSTGNSTGNHLHFEIMPDQEENYIDAVPWLESHNFRYIGQKCN